MPQSRLNSGNTKNGISPLLEDLNFIKQHKRYPINKHTRFVVIAGILGMLFALLVIAFFVAVGPGDINRAWIVPAFFTIIMIHRGYTTISLIRFRELSNHHDQDVNTELLKSFLLQNQLAFYQSPLAPEVFQIASRPLNPEGEQREIMVFIADDRRILLNSHFTSPLREGIPLKISLEYRKMERKLRNWMQEHPVDTPDPYRRKLRS